LTSINDQFLQEIALALGTTKVAPVAQLVDGVMPGLMIEEYRREILVFQDAVTPSGAAGAITAIYRAPVDRNLRLFMGSMANAGNGPIVASLRSNVTTVKGTTQVQVGTVTVPTGNTEEIIGRMSIWSTATFDVRPFEVLIPAGNNFIMDISRVTPPFNAATISWVIVGFTEPMSRRQAVVTASTLTVP